MECIIECHELHAGPDVVPTIGQFAVDELHQSSAANNSSSKSSRGLMLGGNG
jgi:hypothetical protein